MAAVVWASPIFAANLKTGDKAPAFKAIGVDGKDYSLPEDAKATVVCFTCNHCPVAVAYEDRFIEFAKKYEEKGVKFIAINVNYMESLDEMKERAKEKRFTFPYAFDASGKSCFAYGARRTPHLFLVDADGKIAYQGAFDDKLRSPKKHFLVEAVDAVLAGKKPRIDKTPAIGCGIQPKR
jgi:peroxiredoxin